MEGRKPDLTAAGAQRATLVQIFPEENSDIEHNRNTMMYNYIGPDRATRGKDWNARGPTWQLLGFSLEGPCILGFLNKSIGDFPQENFSMGHSTDIQLRTLPLCLLGYMGTQQSLHHFLDEELRATMAHISNTSRLSSSPASLSGKHRTLVGTDPYHWGESR